MAPERRAIEIFVVPLAAWLWASPVRAGEPAPLAEAIQVHLDAPASCGDTARFFDAVRARTPRVKPSEGAPGERRFIVRIVPSALGFEGTLRVLDPAAEPSERALSAGTCEELVHALAIVTALAVDPEATATAGSPPAGEPPPVVPFSGVPSPAVPPPAAADAPPRADSAPAGVRETAPPVDWHVGVAAGVDSLSPGALTFLAAGLTVDAELRRASLLNPSLRLMVRRSLPATVASESGSAEFVLTSTRLEACPLSLRQTEAFRFLPCAVFDGGMLQAEGQNVTGARAHRRPWLGAGLVTRFSFGTSPRADVELGAILPLQRDTFRFTPSEFVYRAEGLAFFVSAGGSFGL